MKTEKKKEDMEAENIEERKKKKTWRLKTEEKRRRHGN